MGKQAGEYDRDVYESPQLGEEEGGTISEPLCTEQVEPASTPNESFEVEDVTNESEKTGSTPTYNLHPHPGRNV